MKFQIKPMVDSVSKFAMKNLPSILVTVGIVGSVTATVVACKETPKAMELLNKKKEERDGHVNALDVVVAVAPAYWPAAVLEVGAVGCIIFANHENLKRQAAALAAYGISQEKLEKYKDAVAKTLGDKKAEEVDQKNAELTAKNNKSPIIITGQGEMMCIDSITGRKFKSDYDKVRAAFESIQDQLHHNEFVSLNDLYYALGIPEIVIGNDLGWFGCGYYPGDPWKCDELTPEFSSQLDADGVPCLVIEYSVNPRWNDKAVY